MIFLNYTFYSKKESFIDTNKNIKSDKNIFINYENYPGSSPIQNINMNKLCIKNGDDIECITKEELFNALNLPEFRRHSVCIDDACIDKYDLKKINGEIPIKFQSKLNNKCVNESNIYGLPTQRKKWLWETGHNYDSKNEPDNGWQWRRCGTGNAKKPKRKSKKWGCYKCDNYKYSGGKAINGCNARHKRFFFGKYCIKSAGRQCKSSRDRKRKRIKFGRRRSRWYTLEGDTLGEYIPVFNSTDCDNSTEFYLKEGDKLENINLIDKYVPVNVYETPNPHDDHLKVV